MAIDFNSPALTSLKANFLTYLRDNIIAVAKMSFSGGVNIPDGCIRWNATGDKFEQYSSATASWGDLSPSLSKVAGILAGTQALAAADITGDVNIGSSTTRKVGRAGTFTGAWNLGAPVYSGTQIQVDASVTHAAWESVGPTGSGADVIWGALNYVPADADWIEVSTFHESATYGGTPADINISSLHARSGDSSDSGDQTVISKAAARLTSAGHGVAHARSSIKIPINSSKVFDLYWYSDFQQDKLDVYLLGWGFNP